MGFGAGNEKMQEKQNIHYPILSQKKIGQLVREFERQDGVKVDFVRANKGYLALHMGLTHKGEGPLDNHGVDDTLGIVGFDFEPSPELDKIYGKTNKYYTFAWRNGLWVALEDNAYSNDWSRIIITWGKKLGREFA